MSDPNPMLGDQRRRRRQRAAGDRARRMRSACAHAWCACACASRGMRWRRGLSSARAAAIRDADGSALASAVARYRDRLRPAGGARHARAAQLERGSLRSPCRSSIRASTRRIRCRRSRHSTMASRHERDPQHRRAESGRRALARRRRARVSRDSRASRAPRTTVLIGATNRAQRLDDAYFDALLERLARVARDGRRQLSRQRVAAHAARTWSCALRSAFAAFPGVFWGGARRRRKSVRRIARVGRPHRRDAGFGQHDLRSVRDRKAGLHVRAAPITGKLAAFHRALRASGHLRMLGEPIRSRRRRRSRKRTRSPSSCARAGCNIPLRASARIKVGFSPPQRTGIGGLKPTLCRPRHSRGRMRSSGRGCGPSPASCSKIGNPSASRVVRVAVGERRATRDTQRARRAPARSCGSDSSADRRASRGCRRA